VKLFKILQKILGALLLLMVMLLFILGGEKANLDYAAKRQFQKFVNQLEPGENIGDVQQLSEKWGVGPKHVSVPWPYDREQAGVDGEGHPGTNLKDLLHQPNQWEPEDLLVLLHKGTNGFVKEPSISWFYISLGMFEVKQSVDVFYDPNTKKVIGWVSYGSDPVIKK